MNGAKSGVFSHAAFRGIRHLHIGLQTRERDVNDTLHARNTPFSLSLSLEVSVYVCPEPVLVKCRFLV